MTPILLLKEIALILNLGVILLGVLLKEKLFGLSLQDKRTNLRKKARMAWLAVVVVLSLINGWIIWCDSNKANQLQLENQRKSEKILNLATTNAALNAKLFNLSQSQVENLTGGKMYCTCFPFKLTNDVFGLTMLLQGASSVDVYPAVHDVKVLITRFNQSDLPSSIIPSVPLTVWEDLQGAKTEELQLGTLYFEDGSRNRIYWKINLSGLSWDMYRIEFDCRNGGWVEILQFAKAGGKWTFAITTMPRLSSRSFIISQQNIYGAFPTNALVKKRDIF